MDRDVTSKRAGNYHLFAHQPKPFYAGRDDKTRVNVVGVVDDYWVDRQLEVIVVILRDLTAVFRVVIPFQHQPDTCVATWKRGVAVLRLGNMRVRDYHTKGGPTVSFSSVPCLASTVPFPMTPPYVGGTSSFLSPFFTHVSRYAPGMPQTGRE